MRSMTELSPLQRVGLAAAGTAGLLALSGCGDIPITAGHHGTVATSSAQETSPTAVSPSAKQGVGRVALTSANLCSWSPSNPQPLVSRNPLKVQIDGRCAEPMGPNYVGVYSAPTQNPDDTHKFRATGPQDVELVCSTTGETILDGAQVYGYAENTSTTWDEIKLADGQKGLVPEFALGYPDHNLTAACTAAQLSALANA